MDAPAHVQSLRRLSWLAAGALLWAALILGKLIPYLVLTFLELCGIALVMRYVFGVPIHGEFVTLLVLTIPFVLTMLAATGLLAPPASRSPRTRRSHAAGPEGHRGFLVKRKISRTGCRLCAACIWVDRFPG